MLPNDNNGVKQEMQKELIQTLLRVAAITETEKKTKRKEKMTSGTTNQTMGGWTRASEEGWLRAIQGVTFTEFRAAVESIREIHQMLKEMKEEDSTEAELGCEYLRLGQITNVDFICPYCGSELDQKYPFRGVCDNCGRDLNEEHVWGYPHVDDEEEDDLDETL